MDKLTLILVFITIVYPQISFAVTLTNVVQTDRGPVQGEILTTVQDSSIEYSSFRGIPFAKPPIGELRFQPPVEADRWSETLIATSNAPECPQMSDNGDVVGNEDCLYLNVYSPRTSFEKGNDGELLAVMVWIYGGVFVWGTSSSQVYGPDYLLANRVLVVTIGYRIGALGFLSIDIDGATGNQGMKDQILALKWIQKNIEKFGGDPNKVTIFGVSSGSDTVLLHQLSPASKGLFRGIIAMSGVPLNPWGFAALPTQIAQAYEIGSFLGIPAYSKEVLYRGLKDASAEDLVRAADSELGTALQMPTLSPTLEDPNKAKDIFLSECPTKIYASGNYPKMPIILGFTNVEAIYFLGEYPGLLREVKFALDLLRSTAADAVPFYNELEGFVNKTVKKLNDIDAPLVNTVLNVISDLEFVAGIDATQRILAQNSPPVYYYVNSFDYPQSRHRLKGSSLNGTGHADDVLQIWWHKSQPLDPNSRIGIQRQRMTRLWTNFAKYLDPTPDGTADPLLNINWDPSGPEGLQMEMGNNGLAMKPRQASVLAKTLEPTLDTLNSATCMRGNEVPSLVKKLVSRVRNILPF